jgi:hypothetical protein
MKWRNRYFDRTVWLPFLVGNGDGELEKGASYRFRQASEYSGFPGQNVVIRVVNGGVGTILSR